MRIFEISDPGGQDQKVLRLAVIGSCRVLEPFEDLAQAGKAKRIWANYSAATLTLGEAIQIVQYTLQERDLPTEFLRFIFGQPEKLPVRDRAQRDLLESCDAFVVEVPELRQFKHKDTYFQVNAFFANFLGKYQGAVAPWYRELSRRGEISEELVETTLKALPQLDVSERLVVESVLRHTRLEDVDANAVRAGIPQLKLNATARVTIVSHFLVPGLEGTSMRDRLEIRNMLRDAAAACGVDFFDPTEMVAKYGREIALNKQGDDIHHYNPEFQHTVAEALLDRIKRDAVCNS